MNLKDLAKATASVSPNHSVLIYGPPKSGKTKLVGTAATLPEINRIYWFDLENGIETLLGMGLTDAQLEKVTVFKIPDTKDNPVAIETMLKVFSAKTPVKICDAHGVVECVACKALPSTSFCLLNCTHNDLVVIDSGSQLGDSALSATMKGRDTMAKPGWDEYGLQSKWLGDILSVIQQAKMTNFVIITHEIALTDDENKDKIVPLMGTKGFCMKVSKYFGTVAYVHKKLNKHVAGSSSTYRSDVLTGSRVNAVLESSAAPDMRKILVDGGILRLPAVVDSVTEVVEKEVVEAPVLTLAQRLAIKK